ncbi:hypothetical protein OH76DRAFT_475772 [Lentinus brumalis]|uniref:Uncharacterized protein n=1 Tax=Lentinus brumalis TaxID=2498619 RepID=A0A371CIC3_9APHY|nr:hypothetical protein OH76DRAFT_475772 [Polyporus brumalis]
MHISLPRLRTGSRTPRACTRSLDHGDRSAKLEAQCSIPLLAAHLRPLRVALQGRMFGVEQACSPPVYRSLRDSRRGSDARKPRGEFKDLQTDAALNPLCCMSSSPCDRTVRTSSHRPALVDAPSYAGYAFPCYIFAPACSQPYGRVPKDEGSSPRNDCGHDSVRSSPSGRPSYAFLQLRHIPVDPIPGGCCPTPAWRTSKTLR